MKHNPKETINIITLVEEFVVKLNAECVEHKVQKHYEITIKDSIDDVTEKPSKLLKFFVSNLDTNERISLYEGQYCPDNVAKFLTVPYKRTLYRELLFNCVGVFAFNMEQNIIHNKTKDRLGSQETFNPHTKE